MQFSDGSECPRDIPCGSHVIIPRREHIPSIHYGGNYYELFVRCLFICAVNLFDQLNRLSPIQYQEFLVHHKKAHSILGLFFLASYGSAQNKQISSHRSVIEYQYRQIYETVKELIKVIAMIVRTLTYLAPAHSFPLVCLLSSRDLALGMTAR